MKVGVILARFQPIHNGHIALIKKACNENDKVLIIIGSADKLNERNPIPVSIRKELVDCALIEHNLSEKCQVELLDDLSSETDNNYEWGFYVYSNIVSKTNCSNFTLYYSDGFEIITSWFPGFILRNYVSLSLLARNSIEAGVSATLVRNLILNNSQELTKHVPKCVIDNRKTIGAFIELQQR